MGLRLGLILFFGLAASCKGDDNLTHCVPAPEECNARDDDCDGAIDEADSGGPLRRDCSNACGPGMEECDNGLWQHCTAPQPTDEICNNFDDNCNGVVDEGCECQHGETRRCGEAVGVCDYGVEYCEHGVWGECQLPYDPDSLVELCDDGLDNDCDGETDEDCLCSPGDTQECGEDEGECEMGLMTCRDDFTWDPECVGAVGPESDICDGLDNDCDGEVDYVASIGFGWQTDDNEPNNSCAEAAPIYNDSGRAELVQDSGWLSLSVDDPSELQTYPDLYPVGDEDWYHIRAVEADNMEWCGIPYISSECTFVARVQLQLLDRDLVEWADQSYEDYRVCVVAGTCSDAMNPDHVLCTHESSWSPEHSSYFLNVAWVGTCGRNDSRDLYIRVHSPTEAACGYYQLSINFYFDSTIPCP